MADRLDDDALVCCGRVVECERSDLYPSFIVGWCCVTRGMWNDEARTLLEALSFSSESPPEGSL